MVEIDLTNKSGCPYVLAHLQQRARVQEQGRANVNQMKCSLTRERLATPILMKPAIAGRGSIGGIYIAFYRRCKNLVTFNSRAKTVSTFLDMSPLPWGTPQQLEILEHGLPAYNICRKAGRPTKKNSPKLILLTNIYDEFNKCDPGFLDRMNFSDVGLTGDHEVRRKAFRTVSRSF